MTEKPNNPQPATLVVGELRASDFKAFYVNGFTFAFSPSDFSITFLSPLPKPGVTIQQQEAVAHMALPTLKTLRDHLNAVVTAYEAELGPIKTQARQKVTPEQIEGVRAILRSSPLT